MTTTTHEDQAIELFRGQLALRYVLRNSLTALTVWAFLYGTVVLALRGALGLSRIDLIWGLCSLPLALIPAVILALRRLPSKTAVRALIDRHSRCGGLLMAGEDQPIGPWAEELPTLHLPVIRWRSGKSWGLLAGGLAFMALAFLVPQGLANIMGPRMDVRQDTEKLAKQIEVLEQEKILDAKRAADLKEKLEQVRKDARGNDPTKTLQALDHVKDLTSKTAREAAEEAARKMEDLGRGETFTEAMEKVGNKLDPKQLTEAVNEMFSLAKKAATEKELAEAGIDGELMEALKKGSKLTPEQMKKLKEALKNLKQDTMGKIGKLVQARLLDPSELEKCDKAGKCDCAELAAFLKENGYNADLAAELANSDEAGNGGITRGPGSSKIRFDHETDEAGFKFKEEELPPSALESLKDSTLAGVSIGTPKVNKEKAVGGVSGALSGAKSGGGSASTQVILPRHRGAVERYFDRPAKK